MGVADTGQGSGEVCPEAQHMGDPTCFLSGTTMAFWGQEGPRKIVKFWGLQGNAHSTGLGCGTFHSLDQLHGVTA